MVVRIKYLYLYKQLKINIMKTIFLTLALFITSNLLSQTTNNTEQTSNVITYSDTIGYDLNKFTSEYATEMSTWSNERKEWFKTFAYTRGNIRIPKEPIVVPNFKN